MRKFFWFIAVIVVVAVGGVFVVPSFMDWNQYKGMATEKVRELTGRELTIAGDVRIAVWPAPALVAEDITFSSLPGSHAPNLASIKAVEVRIALAPLIGGRVQVETVKLIEPIIELERLADGRANWDFNAAETPDAESKPASSNQAENNAVQSSKPDIVLDNFTIENGTLIYRDTATGNVEPVEKLNATISAASVQGPLESTGSLVIRGIPLSYSASLGEIIHDRTVPFNARISMPAGDLSVQAGGSLVNLLETPLFKGNIKVTSQNLALALAELGISAPTNNAALPLNISGQVAVSTKTAEIKDLIVDIAGIKAEGDLRADLGDKLQFGTQLSINRLDTDKLLAALNPEPTTKAPPAKNPSAKPTASAKAKQSTQKTAPKPLRFDLPGDIAGSVILTVDAIGYSDGVVRDVLLNAELRDATLTVQQFSAQFPGGSDVSVSGHLVTPDQVPTFTGELDSTVSDLRGVLSWLKIAPPPVPADRLRKFSVVSQFAVTPEQVQATGLDLSFDSSRLSGGVTVALRKRPGFGAALVLDRLNVDAYLPPKATAKKGKATGQTTQGSAQPNTVSKAENNNNPLSALSVLNTFDANFNVHVKSATYQSTPVKDLVAEGVLYNGALDIKRFSIGKLAGASANLSGKLMDLGNIPAAKNLRISAKVPNLSTLARVTGTSLPLDGKKLGAASLKARLDGSLLAPTVDAVSGLAGAVVSYKGRVAALTLGDMLKGRFSVKHNDLPTLLRRLGVDYRPAGKLGGLNLTGDISGGSQAISLNALKGAIGKTTIGGSLAAALAGPKPRITADLQTGALNIGHFLPAKKSAALRGLVPTLIPAAWRGPARPTSNPSPLLHKTARGQWPTTPLDLSVLNSFDADVAIKTPILIYGRYLAEKADIGAKISNGVLNVERLIGNLFGGALNGTAQVTAQGNRLKSAIKVTGLNVEDALKAVTGEAGANGKMNVAFDVASGGRSVSDLISALGGRGNFALTGMDVKKATKGSMLTGLLGLFTSLNQLGGKSTDDKAAVSASFDIVRGIATTKDLKLASAFGNGGAAGTIDLPKWTINLNGQVQLAESMLMRILKAKVRETKSAVPFSITGSLEAPRVKVDTNAALGAGVPIPGADALLNKAPKGVGAILKGILGGGAKQPAPAPQTGGGQTPPAATPPPPPSDTQPRSDPTQDLLKKLFKKL
ncbi:MAG: AsmA family protein [Rhodospirillaceae bacterium]|nr:AsmA family protein [Rhodospirillaceae bacterium]